MVYVYSISIHLLYLLPKAKIGPDILLETFQFNCYTIAVS